ncbi:MAG: ATP phosphoribosyltransferase [Deltaproteobacteria bacterium]|nr:ATP phosphoribosyltransferase [Deltaproteobacteria bacterium]
MMRLFPADGTVDRLPDEARALRLIEGTLVGVLHEHGYAEVVVPLLERDGVWAADDAVRLVDRSGALLGLRPDFTGSVARLVATRWPADEAACVSYRGTVFREVDNHRGERRQRQQVGFERIGSRGAAGDAHDDVHVLRTARRALHAIGVDATLTLGSAAVVEALCPQAAPDVRAALDARDGTALPPSLCALLTLHGPAKATLARATATLPPSTHAALAGLQAIVAGLGDEAHGVVVDLAEVRPWSWYSGAVFSFTVDGVARAVCAGGRYDGVVGRFGADRPAVGATIDVDALLERPTIGAAGPGPLRVALPKGRLQRDVLRALGAQAPSPEALSSRALVLPGGDGTLSFLLVKDPDIAAYVERGVADVGVVGLDVLRERGGDVLEPLDLPFGRCRLCLCGRPDLAVASILSRRTLRVATKYPKLTRQALAARGLPAEVIPMQGSVELAVVSGLADAIVDLVETGATLRENGLVAHDELFVSTARVVVNRAAFRRRAAAVDAFLSALATAATPA